MALCCAATCSARDFAEKRFPIERLWNNLVKKTQYFGQIEPNYQEIYYDSMWEGKDGPTLMGSVGSLPSSYCQAWPQQRHPPQHLFPPLLPQQPGTSWESKVPSQVEGQGSKGLTGKPRVSWWRSLDWWTASIMVNYTQHTSSKTVTQHFLELPGLLWIISLIILLLANFIMDLLLAPTGALKVAVVYYM